MRTRAVVRPRNHPGQYDDLVEEWWEPQGAFAALHWLAAARAELVPPPPRSSAVLVDLGCGGGLLAPLVSGYRHVGVDPVASAAAVAAGRGISVVRADAAAVPLVDGAADVVVAGEVLEHLSDVDAVIGEVARVLRPGGLFVLDTINDTRWARLALVTVGERLPGGPPPRIHDPDLFVPPGRLTQLCRNHGIHLEVRGLRPSLPDYLRFVAGRQAQVRMLPSRSLAALYQGWGRKLAR